MEKLKRWDKIYLDKDNTEESVVNQFLDCRDGIVDVVEYTDESGYGNKSRIFLCKDHKHEFVYVVSQYYNSLYERWYENYLSFDSDSYKHFEALIEGRGETIRDY